MFYIPAKYRLKPYFHGRKKDSHLKWVSSNTHDILEAYEMNYICVVQYGSEKGDFYGGNIIDDLHITLPLVAYKDKLWRRI